MWKVRAEIVGDFVSVEYFKTEEQAREYADSLELMGIWDSVEYWYCREGR